MASKVQPPLLDLRDVKEDVDDFPKVDGIKVNPSNLPPLIFGGASLTPFYSDESALSSDLPVRLIRLCLRYGINAFDTSPFYAQSETVLGHALATVSSLYPRASYMISTKCGRYPGEGFNYDPTRIASSVYESLQRLNTDYLDIVYLHDAEFVSEAPEHFNEAGNKLSLLGLSENNSEADPRLFGGDSLGPGDRQVVEAVKVLFNLKRSGKIRHVGLSGLSLPTLTRLSCVINASAEPLDIVLSYAHCTIQNSSLLAYAPYIFEKGQVSRVVDASPLAMGLLTDKGAPDWHPAPPELKSAVEDATNCVKAELSANSKQSEQFKISKIALEYAFCNKEYVANGTRQILPCIIGLPKLEDIHSTMDTLNKISKGYAYSAGSDQVRKALEESGYMDWAWKTGKV